jgi:hypothetical protein
MADCSIRIASTARKDNLQKQWKVGWKQALSLRERDRERERERERESE